MELARDDGADAGAGVAPFCTVVTGTSAARFEVAPSTPGGSAEPPPPPPQVEALAASAADQALNVISIRVHLAASQGRMAIKKSDSDSKAPTTLDGRIA